MVLLWEQVAAPIWRSRGVENCVELNGTTSRDLSVFDFGEQQKPTNVNVESAGGKLGRRTVVRHLDDLLFVDVVCSASGTFSPSLHDAFSTSADALLPPVHLCLFCTYVAATELHFHLQNTNCC